VEIFLKEHLKIIIKMVNLNFKISKIKSPIKEYFLMELNKM
jgi:hypothetical protein